MKKWQLEMRFDYAAYLNATQEPAYTGEEAVIDCPDCGKDKLWVQFRPRRVRGVLKSPGSWICYYCNAYGVGPYALIRHLERTNDVYKVHNQVLKYQKDQPTKIELEHLAELVFSDPQYHIEEDLSPIQLPEHSSLRANLTKTTLDRIEACKGISPLQVKKYGIQYCHAGYYEKRIIAPINMYGETVSFVARHIDKKPAKGVKKLLYPKGAKTGRMLYNYDLVKESKYDHASLVITEDFASCIRVDDYTKYHAVASLGTNLSDAQITLLMTLNVEEIILLWDRDATVRHVPSDAFCMKLSQGMPCPDCYRYEKTWRIARALSGYWKVKVPILPDERDPDEHSGGDIEALIEGTEHLQEGNWFNDARALLNRL